MFSKSTVKYIQSLQHKKFRQEHNRFVAEGPKVVEALLKSGEFHCKNLYALPDWLDTLEPGIASQYRGSVTCLHDFELEKISAFSTANKVVGIFERRLATTEFSPENKITLVLDDLQDPGNFGTIIRTADWFGVQNIVCSENTVDMYNPKVVQSTMASLSNVNIIYTNLQEWLRRAGNIPILAGVIDGEPLSGIAAHKEAIIIIGNESNGVSREIRFVASRKITIPKTGNAESLNAAVAAGILMYATMHSPA